MQGNYNDAMTKWTRSAGGLLVPSELVDEYSGSSDSAPSPALSGAALAPRRQARPVADSVQAVGSVVAAVVSAIALLIAVQTVVDQRKVQARSEERLTRRYAERVAWWGNGPNKATLFIENRAPVPMTQIRVVYSELLNRRGPVKAVLRVDEIPPCSRLQIHVDPDGAHRHDPTLAALSMLMKTSGVAAVQFYDRLGHWERRFGGGPDSLRRIGVSVDGGAGYFDIEPPLMKTSTLSDCGTDS